MSKKVNITTIGDLKRELDKYDNNRRVVIQMIDGEYDRVGFIDSISDEHSEFVKERYLPRYEDALMLICDDKYVSSQY